MGEPRTNVCTAAWVSGAISNVRSWGREAALTDAGNFSGTGCQSWESM